MKRQTSGLNGHNSFHKTTTTTTTTTNNNNNNNMILLVQTPNDY